MHSEEFIKIFLINYSVDLLDQERCFNYKYNLKLNAVIEFMYMNFIYRFSEKKAAKNLTVLLIDIAQLATFFFSRTLIFIEAIVFSLKLLHSIFNSIREC